MKIKRILTFLLLLVYNLFGGNIDWDNPKNTDRNYKFDDTERKYRQGWLYTAHRQYGQAKVLVGTARTQMMMDSLNKEIIMSQKELSFLVEKSINSTQKSDLLILKNKGEIMGNELGLVNIKQPEKAKAKVKFVQ